MKYLYFFFFFWKSHNVQCLLNIYLISVTKSVREHCFYHMVFLCLPLYAAALSEHELLSRYRNQLIMGKGHFRNTANWNVNFKDGFCSKSFIQVTSSCSFLKTYQHWTNPNPVRDSIQKDSFSR